MKVLITRPRELGQTLCHQFKTLGHTVKWIPVIECQPNPTFSIAEGVLRLQQTDLVIFISQAAVRFSSPLLKAVNTTEIHWLAIGKGTAKALKEAGISTVLTSPKPPFDSEALLELPILQAVNRKIITIIKGEGGRELLWQHLKDRGATVYHLNVYRRSLPRLSQTQLKPWEQQNLPDVSIVTSVEGLQNYIKLFNQYLPGLKQKPIIVVSQRLFSLAQTLGFQQPCLALGADEQSILNVFYSLSVFYSQRTSVNT